MIKVLNVITDTNIGGAGKILIHYLKNFDRTKFEIYIAVPEKSLLIPGIKEAGYDVIETKHGRDKSFEPAALSELYKLIKEIKPDIVHTHSSLSARVAAYFAGVKSRIYTRHCAYDLPESAKRFPKKQISGFINNTLSTAIVAVADAAAQNLTDTGADARKITVIYNGVERVRRASENEIAETREKLGIKDGDFVCTMCARLEEVKGHEYFIRAAKKIAAEENGMKFLIAGTGSCEKKLKSLASELGLDKTVIFAGFIEDVAPILAVTDLFVNCSWGTEASSLAIAEAMSLNIPTVASDFGGNPSVITDGVNGRIVAKRDPDALASALLEIYRDRPQYEALSKGAGRVFEERFTSRAMTERLERLYEQEYERNASK